MRKNGVLVIGKIVGPHGIRGVMRVYCHVESLDLFQNAAPVILRHPEKGETPCKIKWVKPHKKGALIAIDGIDSRTGAESMKGAEFLIDNSCLPDLEEGTWYWRDLIGISVFTVEGMCLGRLESIIPTGSNDVYVVRDQDSETLVPALESVVIEVNVEEGTMRVDLPEGL